MTRVPILSYTAKDFKFNVNDDEESAFDRELRRKWKEAEEQKLFRYILNIRSWKILEGKYQFLAQLNTDRGSNRRTPEEICSMDQPFDPARFNFTKISEKEMLFDIGTGNGEDVIAINVSPIEEGHCLILTQRLQCLPQCMTKYSLQKAVELLLLSHSSYFRVCFNSLCAHASINHLHWHLYYLKHRMSLENIKLDPYTDSVFLLEDYPAKGFCIKLSSAGDLEKFVSLGFLIVNYFQEQHIAHNVYITRSKSKEGKIFDDLRMYIWARESFTGIKDTNSFIPAVCELFGHLSIRTEEGYWNLTENTVSTILNDITNETYLTAKEKLKMLIERST